MALQALSHIGICVSDLEASIRFYRDGLGFQEVHQLHVEGPHAATLLGLDGLQLQVVYLTRDGTQIELLHYQAPGHVGSPKPREMNARGLTHLSLRTDNLDADLAHLQSLGAQVLTQTRIDNPDFGAQAVFITDPDGTRIELVQMRGDPHQLPGA